MAIVGLLYVGAVLFINGLLLIGAVDPRAAAPINLFVGALQVVTPTYLIFTAGGQTTTGTEATHCARPVHPGIDTAHFSLASSTFIRVALFCGSTVQPAGSTQAER